jgi:peroxiredoxin
MTDLSHPLPPDLPIPAPSKEALHLPGHPLPPLIELASTSGGFVDLFLLSLTRPVLLFVYPRTAKPGEQIQESWNQIPGARGCTPELCGVRDGLQPLLKKEPDLAIFGLSSQSTEYQQEVSQRLHLPFPLLSDSEFKLQEPLGLPTLEWQSTKYLQRITLLLREGQITQVQYPVFPPNTAAENALNMLGTTSSHEPTEIKIDEAYRPSVPKRDNDKKHDDTCCSSVAVTNDAMKQGVYDFHSRPLPPLPPNSRTASMQSMGRRQRSELPCHWRNSLVAIDSESGEFIGVLAQGVVLSKTNDESTSSDGDDPDEAITPNDEGRLDYRAAYIYNDTDLRPPSRAASVLGEGTFAPPPVPDKPDHLRQDHTREEEEQRGPPCMASSDSLFRSRGEPEAEAEGEVVDGRVRVHVHHVETHRPDLLRDRSVQQGGDEEEEEECASEASGSTSGGPAVRLWRKARGGKAAEVKRKAKKAAKKLQEEAETEKKESALGKRTKREPSVHYSARSPPAAGRARGGNAETDDMGYNATVVLRHTTRSEAISHAGDEAAATKMSSKKKSGRLEWQHGTKKSAMSHHLPGNSVLIEFLAGSRIGASMLGSAAPCIRGQSTAETQRGRDCVTPTSVARLTQTGALAYVPVLPAHLLWFFGFGGEQGRGESTSAALKNDCTDDGAATLGPAAVMGEDLIAIIQVLSPLTLLQVATQSVSTACSSVFKWGSLATDWVGSSLSAFAPYGTGGREEEEEEPNLGRPEQGDDDAEDWKWATPSLDSGSSTRTPRPIYRRRKLAPSMMGNFTTNRQENADEDAPPISIVHFDHLGIARRAYTRLQGLRGL